MRVIFAGTPTPAIASLEALAASGHEVVAVLTRPEAPRGRGRSLHPSEVAVAADGPEGIALARKHRPEILLCDLGLPGIDGFEVARQLRSTELGSNMVLAAITGYGDNEDRRRSTEAGFDHHFVKPVDFGVLKEVLAKLGTSGKRSPEVVEGLGSH